MHPKTIVNNYHKVPAKHLKSFSIFSEILPKKDWWDSPHTTERKYNNSVGFIVSHYPLPSV